MDTVYFNSPANDEMRRKQLYFRTLHLDDVAAFRGAPSIDSEYTGTTMNNYRRASDLAHVPEEIIAPYEQRSFGRSGSWARDNAGSP